MFGLYVVVHAGDGRALLDQLGRGGCDGGTSSSKGEVVLDFAGSDLGTLACEVQL